MSVDPNLTLDEYFPRSVAGWRRGFSLKHPLTGDIVLATSSASWDTQGNPSYSKYLANNPQGPARKAIHSKGVEEISWSVSGDLSLESLGLLNLLKATARGVPFNELSLFQGFEGFHFEGPSTQILFDNITFTASQNSPVKFQLSGKSNKDPGNPTTPLSSPVHRIIPSWATGNSYLTDWSITHAVSLSPIWKNNEDLKPGYYRPGLSEWSMTLGCVRSPSLHDTIRLASSDGIVFLNLVVTGVSRDAGDKAKGVKYKIQLTDIALESDEAYEDTFLQINLPVSWGDLWPFQ